MITKNISIDEFDSLVSLIRSRTGLRVSDTKTDDMFEAIGNLLVSRRLTGATALLMKLNTLPSTDTLWQELIDIITVGETYFFRNQDQFNALRAEVIPALVNKRRESGNKYLRLWCAGCATGEEPYSLAILLRELIPDYQSWQITLLATDINEASLERAKRGIYRSWSFRNETPPAVQQRWFKADDDNFRLDPAIKNMVTFRSLNLVSDEYPSFESGLTHLDLILCRNVTIYFDQETTRKVVARFYESLIPNGWLVVGHSEPMASTYHEFAPRNFTNTVLYQKSAEPLASVVQPELAPANSIERGMAFAATPTPQIWPRVPQPAIVSPDQGKTLKSSRPQAQVEAQSAPVPMTAWQRAKAAADVEGWQEALVFLAEAEAEDKFQPQVLYLRAIIQLHLEDVGGAFISLRQALYCDSQFALAYFTLGELYERSGDYKNAARQWKSAQTAITSLEPNTHLPFGEDMTVDMLSGLLKSAMKRLPA